MDVSIMKTKRMLSRRLTLKGIGALGASAVLGAKTGYGGEKEPSNAGPDLHSSEVRKKIFDKVLNTPFIDTHEHLIEESERISGRSRHIKSDDWSMIFSHYLDSDLVTAGMPKESYDKFFSPKVEPVDKWALIEPYWPAVKNTGYGQAVRIAAGELYGVDELSARTVGQVQSGYEKIKQPGFYRHILCELAKIESCQVNSLDRPFEQSAMPTLLMQDISINGMIQADLKSYAEPTGIKLATLADWHSVCDWWFDKYAKYAVAVKSQNAYSRDIDYDEVPAEKVEMLFKKKLERHNLTAPEQKALEDHLFWYAVGKATEYNLPVKLHTGYYAGENRMPLSRLMNNPGSATELCGKARKTRFVFMHICYPYYEEMIALAKAYTNAYIDMCWSWIINPVAAKDFLKKYLVTAPANKILTFGGDYTPVEPVLGHAAIARRGIALALSELVEEGWMSLAGAMELTDAIMHQNAREIFNLAEKGKTLSSVKWD
jgi:predicted TIM-barrel fold metal-dependent hydrolase